MSASQRLDIAALLTDVEDVPPLDAIEVFAAELADSVGAQHVALLLTSLSGSALVRLSHVSGTKKTAGHNERSTTVTLPETAYEEALTDQTPSVTADGDLFLVLVPVTERGDSIGLLELSVETEPDAETLEYLVAAGHVLAYVLIAVRRHTDLFEWGQRDVPFSVAAEIQRRLLPSSYTTEAGPVTLAGWLEPSHNAGGDTFDYSLDREYLYLTLTDAMGHSVSASLLASLVVGTLRNERRSNADPVAQARAAHAQLEATARTDQFVTGLIARLRLADGALEIVNAGHPVPFLVREGKALPLDLSVCPPLGVGPNSYHADIIAISPGDRLVMVTDGYLERDAGRVDIEHILEAGRDQHPRQVVQELARNVLAVTGGRLRDDATVLCVDFYGADGHRDSVGGASPDRLSPSR